MRDLFSSSAIFLKSANQSAGVKRKKSMRDLEKMLMNSPFLSKGEKEKMAKVIPFFGDAILDELKETLIRQNLRYIKNKSTA